MTDYQFINFQTDKYKYVATYDIESVPNVFSLTIFYPKLNRVELFLSVPDDLQSVFNEQKTNLIKAIQELNPELEHSNFHLYNLDKFEDLAMFLLRFQYNTDYKLYNRFQYQNGHLKFNFEDAKHNATAFHDVDQANLLNDYQLGIARLAPLNDIILKTVFQTKINDYQGQIDHDKIIEKLMTQHRLILQPEHQNKRLDDFSWYRFFGFNARNYDLVMLTELLNAISPYTLNQVVKYFKALQNKQTFTPHLKRLYTTPNDDQHIAKFLYAINQNLFSKEYHNHMPSYLWKDKQANNIYHNLRMSNRFLDIFDVNRESQISLKNLAAFLGRTIKESERLGSNIAINTFDELAELLAYNMCDTINTCAVFGTKDVQGSLNDKQTLLNMFPITLYACYADVSEDEHQMTLKESQQTIDQSDYKRLTLDDTSANFATRIIAPYESLNDFPVVDYTFPRLLKDSADTKKSLAYRQTVNTRIKQLQPKLKQYVHSKHDDQIDTVTSSNNTQARNLDDSPVCGYDVLDDTLLWFIDQEQQHPGSHLTDAFRPIYQFYNTLRGANVNQSENQPIADRNLFELAKYAQKHRDEITYFYRNEKGEPINSFATMQLGGVHGAEYNQQRFYNDQFIYDHYDDVKTAVNDQLQTLIDQGEIKNRKDALAQNIRLDLTALKPNFKPYADEILTKSGTLKARKRNGVSLFNNDGALRDEYCLTSNNVEDHLLAFHADFSSFYPTLLTLMGVYATASKHLKNGHKLVVDRYSNMYHKRLQIKKCWKTKKDLNGNPLSDEMQLVYEKSANGYKLILNSASGQSDRNIDNNIRMNNAALSMRIIGQLFALRIGQALALKGCRIPSTNTDGLYVYVDPDDPDPNHVHNRDDVQQVIDEVTENMFIKVDAESLYQFISKDTNNRIEFEEPFNETGKIDDARGTDLTAYRFNRLDKKTNKPPLLDAVLANYLPQIDNFKQRPDETKIKAILQKMIDDACQQDQNEHTTLNRRNLLMRLGWITRSSKLRYTYLNYLKPVYNFSYLAGKSYQNLLTHTTQAKLNGFEPVIDEKTNLPKFKAMQNVNRIYLTKIPKNGKSFTTLNIVSKYGKDDDPFANAIMQANFFDQNEYQQIAQTEKFKITKYPKMPTNTYFKTIELPENVQSHTKEYQNRKAIDQDMYAQQPISTQPVKVINQSLGMLNETELNNLIDELDLDAYVSIVKNTYLTWKN